MSDFAVEVAGVSHRYRSGGDGREWALRDAGLTVARGGLTALLGPNGAGKTTLIKILATLLIPTEGTARVLSHDVVREVTQVREAVGLVLGGERGLYDRLSARDNLVYFSELYGMGRGAGRARVAEVLDLVELTAEQNQRVEEFSRGMKQRLHIARGILHRPRVLLLDEPTIGVDPVGARRLRSLIRHLNDQGTSILLTTHYMHEAEQLADDVSILRGGRIVVRGTPAEVRAAARVRGVREAVADGIAPELLAVIGGWPMVTGVDVHEHQGRQRLLIGTVGAGAGEDRELDRRLQELGVLVSGWRAATLEDAYVEFVAAGRS